MSRPPIPLSGLDAGEFQAVLDAAGVVGCWNYDAFAGRLALSGPVAGLLGLQPDEASRGMSLAALLGAAEEEDRALVENAFHAACEHGGPVEVAFRTVSGLARIVLRGRMAPAGPGRLVSGRGIVLDVTEESGSSGRSPQVVLNRMAEHALALRGLVTGLGRPRLVERVEGVMVELGFELARHLVAAEESRHH